MTIQNGGKSTLQLFVKPKSHEIFVTVGSDKDHCLQGIWASICQKIPIPINTPPKNLWSGNPPSCRFTLLHSGDPEGDSWPNLKLIQPSSVSALEIPRGANENCIEFEVVFVGIALKSFKGSSVTWLHSLTSAAQTLSAAQILLKCDIDVNML